jgi:hypothetical protein
VKKTERIFILPIAWTIAVLFFSLASASDRTHDAIDDLTPAFRHPGISEKEFEARAQSFGVLPVSTFLQKRIFEHQELESDIRAKTIAAQIEWLDAKSSNGPSSAGAIDALLELEDKGDWSEEIQTIFFEFLVRKATLNRQLQKNWSSNVDPLVLRIARHLKRRSVASPRDEQSDMILLEAKKLADTMSLTIHKFTSLPEDVTGVFVNGKWHPKSQKHFETFYDNVSAELRIPTPKVRMTFVSNLFEPKTLLISSAQDFEDLGHRESWIKPRTPCLVDFSAYSSKQIQTAVLGDEKCEGLIGPLATKAQDLGLRQIRDFGSGTVPRDPFRTTTPIDQPPTVRPWFWAAIGGVALVAIAISARGKETQTQPTTNSGW